MENLLDRSNARGGVPDTSALAAPPSLRTTILTCMDARIDGYATFQLERGEAHVLRNAGGVVTEDVVRSLAISQHELGTREVLIVQHRRCGMSTLSNDGFADSLESSTGLRPTWAVEAFSDVEASVRQSIERVRRSPFLALTESVRGFVLDIAGGPLTEVR